ncbi:hypothetical protein RirG_060390 [Rhizophagus irregularis DAOM 197198w]|uniref:Uncharacterized protein n=1 Tax=Rhizophagus irregularis (strain DAOM 197198w) TaxID=1432141 RepID=A0A015K197_RHIIW|nr:hypothetical protein RirG_060390 [Rhizophagus irregularis DAOM 197198w]
MQSGASAFKVIQTSKGKRKLVGYFENWETTLKALDSPPVTLPLGKASVSNQSKKKDQVPSLTLNKKNENKLKVPPAQKKAKNNSMSKDRDKSNQVVLAEILSLLRRLV